MNKRKKEIDIPDKLVEGWQKTEKAIDENAALLSERTYSLGAGGLALSFTVISFIIGEGKVSLDWQAPVIWGLFLICILADTHSYFYAKSKAEKLELLFRNKVDKGEKMSAAEVNSMIDKANKGVRLYNTIVFWTLIVAIVWAAAYSYCLLKTLS